MEFGPHNAITMFAGMAALVFPHQGEAFLGNGAHFRDICAVLHVQHGAHMQAAHGCVRIPGALGAMLGENLIQLFGVIRQIIQTDRAIFNEGNRFPIALHGHHDIEASFTHLSNRCLKACISGAHHLAGMAQIRHHFIKPGQIPHQRAIFLAVEFHNQQAIRFANQHLVNRGAIDRDGTPQIDHGAIHQLHRFRHQGNKMLRCFHRLAEARELANAQNLARLDRPQLQIQRRRKGQSALRPHQQPRQATAPRRPRRRCQRFNIIAAHAAELFGEAGSDFLSLPRTKRAQALDQISNAARHLSAQIIRQIAKAEPRPIRQQRINRQHIIGHQSVADGFGPAGIIRRHAANGAALPGGRVHRIENALRLQRVIQGAQGNARFHPRHAPLGIHFQHAPQVFRAIQHQSAINRLPALAGAAAPRQDRHPFFPANGQGRFHIGDGTRHHYPDWFLLID